MPGSPGLLLCACLACFAPRLRSDPCACCCVVFYAQPTSTFCFRGAAGTAIKCAYGLFQSHPGGAWNGRGRDAETRPEGQSVPRAHRFSCALFLYLNECLPPFEARLASRFAAASAASVTMHAAARMHRGRPHNPNTRDGPERSPSVKNENFRVSGSAVCLPANQGRGGSPNMRIQPCGEMCKRIAKSGGRS